MCAITLLFWLKTKSNKAMCAPSVNEPNYWTYLSDDDLCDSLPAAVCCLAQLQCRRRSRQTHVDISLTNFGSRISRNFGATLAEWWYLAIWFFPKYLKCFIISNKLKNDVQEMGRYEEAKERRKSAPVTSSSSGDQPPAPGGRRWSGVVPQID